MTARVELAGKLVQFINLEQADGRTVAIRLLQGQAELEVKGLVIRLVSPAKRQVDVITR